MPILCILRVEDNEVKILSPCSDILIVHKNEILTKADLTTATRGVYRLKEFKTQNANKKLLFKSTKKNGKFDNNLNLCLSLFDV